MRPSISQIADMLESRRRGAQLGVHLLTGKPFGLQSAHTLLGPNQVEHKIQDEALRSILLADKMQCSSWARDPEGDSGNPVRQCANDVREPSRHVLCGRKVENRRLWWWEGLERGPEEWARIERLEKEGLGLWIKNEWVTGVETGRWW